MSDNYHRLAQAAGLWPTTWPGGPSVATFGSGTALAAYGPTVLSVRLGYDRGRGGALPPGDDHTDAAWAELTLPKALAAAAGLGALDAGTGTSDSPGLVEVRSLERHGLDDRRLAGLVRFGERDGQTLRFGGNSITRTVDLGDGAWGIEYEIGGRRGVAELGGEQGGWVVVLLDRAERYREVGFESAAVELEDLALVMLCDPDEVDWDAACSQVAHRLSLPDGELDTLAAEAGLLAAAVERRIAVAVRRGSMGLEPGLARFEPAHTVGELDLYLARRTALLVHGEGRLRDVVIGTRRRVEDPDGVRHVVVWSRLVLTESELACVLAAAELAALVPGRAPDELLAQLTTAASIEAGFADCVRELCDEADYPPPYGSEFEAVHDSARTAAAILAAHRTTS